MDTLIESELAVNGSQAFTQQVAASIVGRKVFDMPTDVLTIAKQCVLDTLGVSYAGASEDLVCMLADQAAYDGATLDGTGCTLVGRRERVPMSAAALINGAMAHALDYDDVNMSSVGHPSAAILPSLLALAERRNATGAMLLEAFVAGYEAMCQIGVLIAVDHYARGFHTTATLGSYGAAAGCARLLQLNEHETRMALGLVGTQAAGLKMMFGTMCKPLHAGSANQRGLLSATLAQRGFTSRPDVLEGRGGLFQTQCGEVRTPEDLFLPERYLIRENLFKYHASCYNTHAAIESVLKLSDGRVVNPADISEIVIYAERGLDTVCNIFAPQTGLEAKFSFRQTCAFALAGLDTSDIQTFSDDNAQAAPIRALRDKVRVELVDASSTFIRCDWRDAQGVTRTASHDSGVPSSRLDEQGRRLRRKFDSLVGPLAGTDRCYTIADIVERLDQMHSLQPLFEALQRSKI
jgi:2-methylcitrate dehydratase PrpD